jgi:hypothetical protein
MALALMSLLGLKAHQIYSTLNKQEQMYLNNFKKKWDALEKKYRNH